MLTSKQRSYLRSLGNTLTPVLQIGKSKIDTQVIKQMDGVLETRELIKVRVLNTAGMDVDQVAELLAKETGAEIVQVIGHNILFYRRSTKRPKIELP